MDKKEALKSMLYNLINDKTEEASLDLHNYLVSKMKDVSGLQSTQDAGYVNDDKDDNTELDFN
jgi:hypothetical protein